MGNLSVLIVAAAGFALRTPGAIHAQETNNAVEPQSCRYVGNWPADTHLICDDGVGYRLVADSDGTRAYTFDPNEIDATRVATFDLHDPEPTSALQPWHVMSTPGRAYEWLWTDSGSGTACGLLIGNHVASMHCAQVDDADSMGASDVEAALLARTRPTIDPARQQLCFRYDPTFPERPVLNALLEVGQPTFGSGGDFMKQYTLPAVYVRVATPGGIAPERMRAGLALTRSGGEVR